MKNPLSNKHIEISWERMANLVEIYNIETDRCTDVIMTEEDLNDYFANGRTTFSVYKKDLYFEEIDKLNNKGIEWEEDGLVCLWCTKETYPGVYYMGEF